MAQAAATDGLSWRSQYGGRVNAFKVRVRKQGQSMERAQSAAYSIKRAQGPLAYMTLLATCVAGILHAPWWAACAGACSLALISLIGQRAVSMPQMQGIGAIREPVLILSSVLNASAVASAAFVFGHIARWFWGL